jgi:Rieske Fe-S protein
MNFEGPAPRPLDRFEISVAEDGQLLVDKSVTYKMRPDVEPDDQYPQSVLKA